MIVAHGAHIGRCVIQLAGNHVYALMLRIRFAEQVNHLHCSDLCAHLLELLVESTHIVYLLLNLGSQLVRVGLEGCGSLVQNGLAVVHQLENSLAGNGLDTTHACGNRSLTDDLERTCLGSVVEVGTAAKLDGVAGLYHADGLAVFLAEQRHSALFLCFVDAHFLGDNRDASQNRIVNHILDLSQLLSGQRCKVGEVEADMIVCSVGACLLNMVAEHGAERLLEQVGGGVCTADGWR